MPKPDPVTPPLPASLAEEMPAPKPEAYAFGALIMRVGDSGAVVTDLAAGYSWGFSYQEAETDFLANVRRAYPGHSITKAIGQLVEPLPAAPPAA